MKVQCSTSELNEQSTITLEEVRNIPLPDDILSCHDASAKGSQSPRIETPTSHDSDIKDNLKGDEVMEAE